MNNKDDIITLFHCSTLSLKESILNKGLLLLNSRSKINGIKPIFLSNTPEHIFGNTCFKVCIPKSWVQQTVNSWEFICNRDIPPDYISFYSYEEDE